MARDAEDPSKQITSILAAARLYGHFADGKQPDYDADADLPDENDSEEDTGSVADRIRAYVIERFIDPARQRGEATVTVRAGDVHSALNLSASHPNVCQALRGAKLQRLARVPAPIFLGPDNSSATSFTYALDDNHADSTAKEVTHIMRSASPINLILYGPPGTGKTFATAAKAVELCGEAVPAERGALMTTYHALQAEGRIAFVTFHQNYSYEEFVEGLRPEIAGDDTASAGFRLEPRSGIFREICALAEQARTRTGAKSTGSSLDLNRRRFWKMGQGAIGSEDDVYEDAIANDYITLGWGGTIDWSDERFSSFDAIKAEWLRQNPDDDKPSNWTQMWPFRCEMKPGDIVIVPFGNSAFRAVAEVTGDYYYEASAEGYYAHRRPVRWLLTLEDPLPLDTIVDGKFTMRTLYALASKRVNLSALSRLLPNNKAEAAADIHVQPDQFVLIIDEINRANISKVFGELITLLEPDKRLGMPNALTVTLPYSKKRDFGVPANLHIVGTMNTADRSIALLDTALRRRFVFHELAPDSSLLPERVGDVPLRRVLETINDRIEYLIDREHRIGHAFFLGDGGIDRAAIDATMREKVIPLLQEYFFEDWGRVAAVLGERSRKEGGFLDCRKLRDPTGRDGEERESWSVRKKFADYAYDQLVGRPVLAEAAENPLDAAAE